MHPETRGCNSWTDKKQERFQDSDLRRIVKSSRCRGRGRCFIRTAGSWKIASAKAPAYPELYPSVYREDQYPCDPLAHCE